MNLVEALLADANKSREFIKKLDETAELMHGEGKTADDDPGLALSKALTESTIKAIETAIGSGDLVEMVKLAQLLGIGGEKTND